MLKLFSSFKNGNSSDIFISTVPTTPLPGMRTEVGHFYSQT
jgi:hypothetical protein